MDQIQELISLNTNFWALFLRKITKICPESIEFRRDLEINHQGKVGVFVNETVEKITEISEKTNLNFIQLHGDEDEEFIKRLRQKLNENTKIIKVIRIGDDKTNFENEIKNVKSKISNLKLLFDTVSKAFGGTGKTFDWQILNEIEIPIPYF